MCDVLVTADGIELWTPDELRRYGVAVPEWACESPGDWHRCLCGLDVPVVLAGHPSAWREEFPMAGGGWEEVGPDGRTWREGFDVEVEDPQYARMVRISRSDGRRAMTLEEWEAARASR